MWEHILERRLLFDKSSILGCWKNIWLKNEAQFSRFLDFGFNIFKILSPFIFCLFFFYSYLFFIYSFIFPFASIHLMNKYSSFYF